MTQQISIYNGSWQSATHVYLHTGSGQWPEARGVWIYDGSVWRKGWPPSTSASNWTDPDGVSDGQNSISSTTGVQTVTAANRLYIDLVPPFASNYGYAIGFRLKGTNSLTATTTTANLDIEVSEDGGAYVNKLGYTINLSGALQTQTTPITSGAFTSQAVSTIRVRPKLYVDNVAGTGTITGDLYVFVSTWNTDNYNLMWE